MGLKILTRNVTGNYNDTFKYLNKLTDGYYLDILLNQYGIKGVAALKEATPKDTGETAAAWRYEIKKTDTRIDLSFINDHATDRVPIVIVLQYGHATRNGGWVEGRDFINPAIQPIFDELIEKIWKELTSK